MDRYGSEASEADGWWSARDWQAGKNATAVPDQENDQTWGKWAGSDSSWQGSSRQQASWQQGSSRKSAKSNDDSGHGRKRPPADDGHDQQKQPKAHGESEEHPGPAPCHDAATGHGDGGRKPIDVADVPHSSQAASKDMMDYTECCIYVGNVGEGTSTEHVVMVLANH